MSHSSTAAGSLRVRIAVALALLAASALVFASTGQHAAHHAELQGRRYHADHRGGRHGDRQELHR